MSYYTCVIAEVETKFNVLSEKLSVQYDWNPIESIRIRPRSPESIREKMIHKGFPLTVESTEESLDDIAGVRIICSFPSDIYALADPLLEQDDIHLIEKKNYVKHPKTNGYHSLHLIIETPIYPHDTKKMMEVEIRFRTISMDCWVSLEHGIHYEKDLPQSDLVEGELVECTKMSPIIGTRMENLYTMAIDLVQKDPGEKENQAQGGELWENFYQGLEKK